MAGYSPLYIKGMTTGLVQSRENFILPDDAYPTLQNAYVWRERIKRKQGFKLLGRLQRAIQGLPASVLLGSTDAMGNLSGNIFTTLIGSGLISSTELPSLVPGTTSIRVNTGSPYIEPTIPNGTISNGTGGTGTINYSTGAFTILNSGIALTPVHPLVINYYPGLPVMGLRIWEQPNSTNDLTIAFDQRYAYTYNGSTKSWQEWIPGKTWNAQNENTSGISFFWSTNYWVSDPVNFTTSNVKLFWETNNTGQFGANADPIRISDGLTWLDFSPANGFGQIDSAPTYLLQCLAFLPFRGRLVAFNTYEGSNYANGVHYSNRIRWSTIGNPFIPYAAGPPATGSWRDDIRGQGGFLDIPTSEDIVGVGFVRDNLVIYCERSTWQLRYTGRSIAPFQIEKVNSELGAEGTFSAVQFDTSLIGIGDKGVVECDSFKSQRIDVKIPDLVFDFQNSNNGPERVHGIRDFERRLAYWTYPSAEANGIFPDQRLVYNYDNDSWAIFTDSLTCLGTFQYPFGQTWLDVDKPWIECNFSWIQQTLDTPSIIAGNQQGFVETLDQLTTNDISLFISNITGNDTNPTVITSPNHNMQTGFVIQISNIPVGTPFSNLNVGNANNGIYSIVVIDANTFSLFYYDPTTFQFSKPQLDTSGQVYIGGGTIAVRDNFNITSKKFNFLDEGESIQMGFLDILMDGTYPSNNAGISLNVFLDYNDASASNTLPENEIDSDSPIPLPDTFFNQIIPTTQSTLNSKGGTKFWQRVYCPTRANFLTIQYTFNNAQMAGIDQESDVQIDSQILWLRKAGRLTQI